MSAVSPTSPFQWTFTVMNNSLPVLSPRDFTPVQLLNFIQRGELNWVDLSKTTQKRLVDSQLFDKDGNILPRIKIIRHESKWINEND